jgi:hypothetical protein
VRAGPKVPTFLRLHFQCQDQEKLRNLAQPGRRQVEMMKGEEPPGDERGPRPNASHDQITLRSVPKTSDLPQPLYQRTVTLSLRDRPTWDILAWFKQRTSAQNIPTSPEDQELMQEYATKEVLAAEQREQSKVIQAEVDRERKVLEQAKKIAEQNAAEAAL